MCDGLYDHEITGRDNYGCRSLKLHTIYELGNYKVVLKVSCSMKILRSWKVAGQLYDDEDILRILTRFL